MTFSLFCCRLKTSKWAPRLSSIRFNLPSRMTQASYQLLLRLKTPILSGDSSAMSHTIRVHPFWGWWSIGSVRTHSRKDWTNTWRRGQQEPMIYDYLPDDRKMVWFDKRFWVFRKWQSGKPSDLFSALQNQANNDSSLALYPNTAVSAVMSSWTNQSGYPLLQVNIDYTSGDMSITQVSLFLFLDDILLSLKWFRFYNS